METTALTPRQAMRCLLAHHYPERDAQRRALHWLLDHHPQRYQAVLRTGIVMLEANDPRVREQALHDYLQARMVCGDVIMREMPGREQHGTGS